ncbi:hypothetical protein SAMN05444920_101441 [Nonomuraea solani]|uniref:Uncharacterized protein n=1 Tax=Nonomuraea solani TaxID=1144553 RepID=A0A1H5U8B2_9ACTN|nr:hypothetical protein [Nonomuraea solani]SEF71250.1 hypothetical protein SAMN05444920_101441 [Nonomuraea solani]
MAFLSRLFKRGDPLAEREEARRRGMRDARRHPLGEFTDPEFQPSYVTEIRALAREQVTEVDRRLAATRTALLERALGEREVILRELARSDTRPDPQPHTSPPPYTSPGPPPHTSPHTPGQASSDPPAPTGGARPGSPPHASSGSPPLTSSGSPPLTNGQAPVPPDDGVSPPPVMDPFISIAEARARRAEARRRVVVEESNAGMQRARARIEHLTQEWESALIERDHEVEAVHARAEQLVAAYKSGVLRAHPRKEEVPALWKGEVIAMDATGGTSTAISGREEIGRILREVEDRIEVWHAEVLPRALPGPSRAELPPPATGTSDTADTEDAGATPQESAQGAKDDD